ncbi:gliding motility-associated C-terminal domain-containing protein [Flavobacterium sp. GT3P67]|uniref:DUF7507 domain-containing protein n=1 Tax=Flavobacterium sp. GT3P67 TaxID=2541722 RepID=UPI00104810D4|nr:gliding motility-associated C-terminal domain-containing protein [Flavobacterium sp. GT3P67]TDE54939.1 DUF11 domain-containing protein [Flavobacterium sp. GT3P67]
MFKDKYSSRIVFFLFVFFALFKSNLYGQCNTEDPIPFIDSTFGSLTAEGTTSGGLACLLCSASNEERLIDADLTNFATASVPLGIAGSVHFKVTDSDTDYASGTFVGYRIAPSGGILSLELLNKITIKTYLNGNSTPQETFTGNSLLSLSLLSSPGNYIVGFNSTNPFDAIEISVGSLVGLLNSVKVYYPVIRNYCAGPALDCNVATAMNLPTFPVSIENTHTGLSGVSVGSISGAENVTSSNTTDFATINLTVGLLASGSIAVKDQVTDYPAGTFAGFEIENSNLVSVSALGSLQIRTYSNGILREEFAGNSLLVNGVLLSATGRYKLGFVSNSSFDEVRITVNQAVGINLGSTKVYSAVFEKFCAGPSLPCNTQTALIAPAYPVYVNGAKTGIDGVVCALCSVTGQDNLIDVNTTNYAEINLTTSVGTKGSLSIKDEITDYPAGTFAGYDIENPSLLNVNVFDAISITTYLNGTEQETKSGNAALISIGTNLLVGTSRQTIGFVSTLAFDEVRITLTNLVSVNLGITKVYAVVFQKYCEATVACNESYAWTNPDFPVVIDGDKTGVDGVACVACAVNNTNNVLTSDITDFAKIDVIAGVIGSGSIAVIDQLYTYPAGTFAGFVIKDLNTLLQLNLFQSLTVTTYNNGVLQESKSGGQLIDLTLLSAPILGSGPGYYNVGFNVSLPFDEIKFTVGSLVGVINSIRVYGAFVDTKNSSGDSLVCVSDLAVIKTVNNSAPNVGSNVTFTITATNNGPRAATGVSVVDVLPSGYTFVNATPSAGTTWSAPNWTIGALANGASATLNIVATVNATGVYANTATISGGETDPNSGNNSSTVTPTVTQADLTVTKTVSNATPNVGSNVTFTIMASNNGPSDATGVSVADVLPSGYTFVSASPSAGTTWSAPNWTIGTLANGTSATLNIVATVNATGVYANTATISGGQTDPDPGNNSSTVTPTPTPQTDLTVIKTINNLTPNVGSNVSFTITATNNGPSAATGVSVSDALPSGYTFVSATPSAGTTWSAPNWTVGTLANGSSATLNIVATVNATGAYANTATISGGQTDPNPGNNSSTVTPTPIPRTDLAVIKTVSNMTPNVGSNVTFTITATNNGPSAATGVSVADALPSGYTFVSASPSTGTWTAPNWIIGALANGASATLDIVATVNATGVYANTATISGGQTDPSPGNNSFTVTPTPVAQTDLAVIKTVSNMTPNVGSNVTFTITATNNGPSAATGVSVVDVLPSGYTFVSATPSTGTWTAPNWTIGALANGASATLDIVATLNATGPYANTATISGGQTDPSPGNNSSTVTPTPVAQTDLAVIKTVSNMTPNVGSNVTFTITATNNGPSAATGVSVADALPSGYTFVSASPSTGTWTAPNWTIGALSNGASATLDIVATVNATGPYANTATISGGQTDPSSGNNSSMVTPTPVAQTDLAVTKTVSNMTPNVGSNVTFTITATNNGPSAATGVSVADALPSGYTFVSANPSTGTWTEPNWTIGALSNGASATLDIVATVKATGSYTNTATISGGQTDPTPGNNSSTVSPTPVAQTDLTVTKTVNNATPDEGSNVSFTITATNNGPSAATGVSVADALPSGYTFVSASPSAGTWTAPNWTIGTLANGASATLNIVATVNATGPYANTATISGGQTDPTPGNNSSTVTPVPVPPTGIQADLAVTKTVNSAAPNVGSNVTFTITATNIGPNAATGVSVVDVLPSGYTFVSATPSTGTWTAPNWTIGALAIGAITTLDIVATVNATGPYANTAIILGGQTDPTPGNNSATATLTPVAQTDLAVTKTVSNATPNVGSNVTFTIMATNNGPSDATGVSVADVLPSGYTFVSATPSTGTWTAPNWTIGTLANGASVTLDIIATVNATGPYANTATISGGQADPTSGNNSSTATITPAAQTDLAVTKTVNNLTPNVGSNVTFTITVTNNGPGDATGVSVADVLPSGYTFVSATPSAGAWSAPNWTIGILANGSSVTLDIVATVNATGVYANTATISGEQTDPNSGDNSSTVAPVPVPQTDLTVTKTVSNISPNVGSNVTFTITATNNGPGDATGVSVLDALPSGYTFVSAIPSAGTAWSAPNWTIGVLANGANATLDVIATVNATGVYVNTATISGGQTDPNPGNNSSTVSPTPIPQTDLIVTKTVSNTTPNVGSNISFTITAINNGPSDATGVSVADVLPSGYTFVSASPSAGTTWTAPNWTIGALANGATATLDIVVTVNATGSYVNTATISGGQTDPNPGNNSSTVTPTPTPQTDLTVTKTVNNPTPNVGSNISFTITTTNNGPSDATGVSVVDALPSGYTFVSATPSTGTWIAPDWTIGALVNGASATLEIVATVNGTGVYANTATISGGQTDPSPGNNSSTVTPAVIQADLTVTKTVSNATPNVGSNVTFTIMASNNGPSAATGVSVADVLASGYTFVSATPSTGTWSAPNWTIGTLANGTSATLNIVATVNATGVYANTATISGGQTDPNPGNNSSTVTPTPIPQTDLTVIKTINNPTPNVGSNISFTITATNNGQSDATGVSVLDALPSGYTFVSASPSTGTWTAPNWIIGALSNGASATLEIVARVNTTGVYANTATISGGQTDPNSGNNSSTVTPAVIQADLIVIKTVNNATPNVGSNVTFTITTTNNGPSDATGVSVLDALPSGYTFVSASPSTGIWTAPNWTIGALANGASATLDIVAKVNATGPYANTATISGGQTDPTPGNNSSTVSPTPVAQTDLTVIKTVSNMTPNVGSNVTFTITTTNNGPSDATGVSVSDALPLGYTFVSVSPSTGTWSAPNWTIGTLANGASATLDIIATVNATGPYANTATISGGQTDPTLGNNNSTVTPTPVAQTDLTVIKTVSNMTPNVGSNVTFTITTTNNGPSDATGVSVSDALPSGYTFVSASPSAGTWTAPNWTIGALSNGASATLDIIATVNATGPYANTATISGGQTDPTPGNNSSTVSPIPVSSTPLITLTKDGTYVDKNGDGITNIGDVITYTFVVANRGNRPLTNVTLTDNNATVTGGPLATLAVGAADSTTFTAVHIVSQTDIDAGIVYNFATVSGTPPTGPNVTATSTDPTPCVTCPVNPACPTCTTTPLTQNPAIALIKTAVFEDNNGDGFAQVGEIMNYAFTVINMGNVTLNNVRITDLLPGIVLTGGPISLSAGESNSTAFVGVYTLTQQDVIAGSVVNQATVYGTSPLGIIVTDLSDNDSPLEDDSTVLGVQSCALKVFNALSPNGDGSNDIFYIRGLECYPNNTVEIYNRWGVKVYDAQGYDNNNIVFRGMSEGRGTINQSEGLPTGTYFYIIKYSDLDGKGIDKSGYLHLNRD